MVYSIATSAGRILQFCIVKLAFRLGEDIVGWFDFSRHGDNACFQIAVTLESEEELTGDSQSSATTSSAAAVAEEAAPSAAAAATSTPVRALLCSVSSLIFFCVCVCV